MRYWCLDVLSNRVRKHCSNRVVDDHGSKCRVFAAVVDRRPVGFLHALLTRDYEGKAYKKKKDPNLHGTTGLRVVNTIA